MDRATSLPLTGLSKDFLEPSGRVMVGIGNQIVKGPKRQRAKFKPKKNPASGRVRVTAIEAPLPAGSGGGVVGRSRRGRSGSSHGSRRVCGRQSAGHSDAADRFFYGLTHLRFRPHRASNSRLQNRQPRTDSIRELLPERPDPLHNHGLFTIPSEQPIRGHLGARFHISPARNRPRPQRKQSASCGLWLPRIMDARTTTAMSVKPMAIPPKPDGAQQCEHKRPELNDEARATTRPTATAVNRREAPTMPLGAEDHEGRDGACCRIPDGERERRRCAG